MSLLAYLAGHVVSSRHRSDVNDKTPRAHDNFKFSLLSRIIRLKQNIFIYLIKSIIHDFHHQMSHMLSSNQSTIFHQDVTHIIEIGAPQLRAPVLWNRLQVIQQLAYYLNLNKRPHVCHFPPQTC